MNSQVNKLVVVQGPTQALASLVVIRKSLDQNESSRTRGRVYFLIGDLCAGKSKNRLFSATKKIIRSNGFYNVFDVNKFDLQFYAGLLRFENYCEKIYSHLSYKQFEEIYVCRRMALLNEAVIALYPNSKKICYGDGFGGLDNGPQNWCASLSPNGFQEIDECAALAPFEENYRGSLGKSVFVLKPTILQKVISKSLKAVMPNQKMLEKQIKKEKKVIIITTSNLLESGSVKSTADEISFYLDNINHLKIKTQNVTFLIKGHPRETKNQSNILSVELRRCGFNSLVLKNYNIIPLELLISLIKPVGIIPLLSSSGFSARILNPAIAIHYSSNSESSARKWLININTYDWVNYTRRLQALTLFASYPWDDCVKYASLFIFSFLFRNLAVTFPPVKQVRKEKEEQFRVFRRSFFSLCLLSLQSRARRLQKIQSLIPA